MDEWISVKEKKPKHDINALVYNEKGFMCGGDIIALYSAHYDVWRLYDLSYRPTITIEVTHYFPIPTPPRLRDV